MNYLIGEEWAVHRCKDAEHCTLEHQKEMTRIAGNPYSDGVRRLYIDHDTSIWIRYCPWCGCDLDKEALSHEELSRKYRDPMWQNIGR